MEGKIQKKYTKEQTTEHLRTNYQQATNTHKLQTNNWLFANIFQTKYEHTTNKLRTHYEKARNKLGTRYKQTGTKLRTNYEQNTNILWTQTDQSMITRQ